MIRSGFEATRILAWRDLRLWATSGGCGQPPRNIMINKPLGLSYLSVLRHRIQQGTVTTRLLRRVLVLSSIALDAASVRV